MMNEDFKIVNGCLFQYLGHSKFVEIPDSVEFIGSYAFGYNELTSVIIPSSVDIIGEMAFYDNNLTSVVIPASVISIGYGAFRSNPIKEVTIYGDRTKFDLMMLFSNVDKIKFNFKEE